MRSGSLKCANLKGTCLQNSSLQHVDLSGACLRDAILSEATLVNVNLEHTDLAGSWLCGTDFSTAHGIPILTGSSYDDRTRFPVGVAPRDDMHYCDSRGRRVQACQPSALPALSPAIEDSPSDRDA